MNPLELPTHADVLAAAARVAPHARVTPVLRSSTLDALAGCRLHFKCEALQHGGAFKFRGALNAVLGLDVASAGRGVVTQSSGNHGIAVARACALRGVQAHVVVPEGAPHAKLAQIAQAGARIVRCAPTMAARTMATEVLIQQTGGVLVHPFDDPAVIAGQGTAAMELLAHAPGLDVVMTPVGGGGLLSGTALWVRHAQPQAQVWGAEPEGARDAHDSLAAGHPIIDRTPNTLCDGLRGHLSARTHALISTHCDGILLASEAAIIHAMALVWTHLKVVIEPSAAVPLACVLAEPERFKGAKVGIVLSGGNVDLPLAAQWFAQGSVQ